MSGECNECDLYCPAGQYSFGSGNSSGRKSRRTAQYLQELHFARREFLCGKISRGANQEGVHRVHNARLVRLTTAVSPSEVCCNGFARMRAPTLYRRETPRFTRPSQPLLRIDPLRHLPQSLKGGTEISGQKPSRCARGRSRSRASSACLGNRTAGVVRAAMRHHALQLHRHPSSLTLPQAGYLHVGTVYPLGLLPIFY
jgi:hypothetical protein